MAKYPDSSSPLTKKSLEKQICQDAHARRTNETQNIYFVFFPVQNKEIAKKTLHLIDKLGSGLLAVKVPGEKPSVFHTDKLSVTLDRQTPAKMSGKTLGEGKEKVSLPTAKELFGADAAKMKSVDAQVGIEFAIGSS